MRLTPGTRVGPYEVVGLIGAGGMGEVYRAKDLRLSRDVAIKVLPATALGDPDRMRRFEQEARAAGSLNHPNVVAIFDTGIHEGAPFVVSELLEGETLQALLVGGPLPLRKIVDYTLQIASGLAAAHEKGIVHRDLKPNNVFVTHEGLVKLLDFGLAKVRPDAEQDLTATEETLDRHTAPGTVLGTAGYMSPEQVRGLAVDVRSDVFALGAILYEMLSGRRAFHGDTAVETMHAILKDDPPDIARAGLPPALDRIVRRCLEKRTGERFQSARDVGFALEAVSLGSTTAASPALAAGSATPRWPWVAAALAGGLALLAAGYLAGGRSRAPELPRYTQVTFRRGLLAAARFAPDGQTIVYSMRERGPSFETFSARPGNSEARPLGLPDGLVSSISPTGDIAYLLRRPGGLVLARAAIAGGEPRELAENIEEADWAPDGTLAVTRGMDGLTRLEYPIGRVLYESPYGVQSPSVSPRGDRVAFYESQEGRGTGAVMVVDREGKRTILGSGFRTVRDAYTSVKMQGLRFAPSGDEVWFTAREAAGATALHALSLGGGHRVVARIPGAALLRDIAKDGRVLISRDIVRAEIRGRGPGDSEERDLSWLDGSWVLDLSPDGRTLLFSEQGEGGGPDRAIYLRGTDGSPAVRLGEGIGSALSADGKWALSLDPANPGDIRLLPTGPGEPRSVRVEGVSDCGAVTWLPDGERLLVTATEPGHTWRVYVQSIAGGPPRPVTPEGSMFVWSSKPVSPDGRSFFALAFAKGYRIYPVEGGEGRPIAGLDDNVREVPVRWSDDGRSIFVWHAAFPPSLLRVDLATGRRTPWRTLEPPDMVGVSWLPWALPTPDGRAYVYSYRRTISDLYVVEGFR
jgi:hypothetical protein